MLKSKYQPSHSNALWEYDFYKIKSCYPGMSDIDQLPITAKQILEREFENKQLLPHVSKFCHKSATICENKIPGS